MYIHTTATTTNNISTRINKYCSLISSISIDSVAQIKDTLIEEILKQDPSRSCIQETHFKIIETLSLNEGLEKDLPRKSA